MKEGVASDERTRQQVEKLGVIFEQTGVGPMVGRVVGCLILAEPPYKSFDEIVSFLGASKSAVSNALTLLQSLAVVDYFKQPGDRKRYFRLNIDQWEDFIHHGYVQMLSRLNAAMDETLSMRSPAYPEFNKKLREVSGYFKLYAEQVAALGNRLGEVRE